MRTAVGAPAPRPSAEEMLDALDRMTPAELRKFRDAFVRELGVRVNVSTAVRVNPVNAIGGPPTSPPRGVL